MTTLYITHPACRLHEMGSWHPESPQRLDAISDQLLASGIMPHLDTRDDVPRVTREAALRVHTAAYLDELAGRIPREGYASIDPDTMVNPHSLEAAERAAGAVVAAVDAVMTGDAENAFCAVRPPGHHACPDKAMGFCLLGNVAIAARHAIAQYGLTRVAIIDFDVHHGNGTEAALAGDPHVLMCSFYQHPFFPFREIEHPADNMDNTPFAAYTDGAAVRQLVAQDWVPRLDAFKPELILISAGFDAHREDDLGQMKLVESDYAWMTEQIVAVAARHAQGRVVSCLEGGYNLSALGRSVTAHLRALAGL
ncbi:histone deacetylase family protein [Pigmentiphaga aceris]|uniref:Histone deacetylase family protein n=1 Tax=Pigmentiphaga aceris TaxID=1940612 RepID=A0A5C0AY01_9BURK|nr:histone deacetylase family protein [Pigmentiphaga aceris]QEI05461.1 histone deacetylase family protein [Pigmentiphaga aceris]